MRPDVNVILIVIDTLRKDYAEPLERSLKKLGFTIYDNAIAPAPWTVPSHASMFTGLYPIHHGAYGSTRLGLLGDDYIVRETSLCGCSVQL